MAVRAIIASMPNTSSKWTGLSLHLASSLCAHPIRSGAGSTCLFCSSHRSSPCVFFLGGAAAFFLRPREGLAAPPPKPFGALGPFLTSFDEGSALPAAAAVMFETTFP